jgi:hypothetical protein
MIEGNRLMQGQKTLRTYDTIAARPNLYNTVETSMEVYFLWEKALVSSATRVPQTTWSGHFYSSAE